MPSHPFDTPLLPCLVLLNPIKVISNHQIPIKICQQTTLKLQGLALRDVAFAAPADEAQERTASEEPSVSVDNHHDSHDLFCTCVCIYIYEAGTFTYHLMGCVALYTKASM